MSALDAAALSRALAERDAAQAELAELRADVHRERREGKGLCGTRFYSWCALSLGHPDACVPTGVEDLKQVLVELGAERVRLGDLALPDGTGFAGWRGPAAEMLQRELERSHAEGRPTFAVFLDAYVAQAVAEEDLGRLRAALVRAGGALVAWLEDLDRRSTGRTA